MSGQIAVIGSKVLQSLTDQRKMRGFLGTHTDPIIDKRALANLRTKPRHQIPGKIDGVKFDMGNGMKHGNSAGPPSGRAPGHIAWCF